MAGLSREQKLDLIYKNTHSDFKGIIGGARTMLMFRGGSCIVSLNDLTDEEIARDLPYALKKEAEKKSKGLYN